jgi:drug/metabolite transporter (DMT)-like permease
MPAIVRAEWQWHALRDENGACGRIIARYDSANHMKSSTPDSPALGYFFGFLGVLAFSFSLPMSRIAVRELDPTFIALGRALLAAVLSGGLLFATRQPIPTRAQALRLAVVALGVVIGFPLLSTWALRFVDASHSAIINGLAPLATATLGALVQRQRPSPLFWFAALTGSLAVAGFVLSQSGSALVLADALMLGAVGAVAIGYVEGGRMSTIIGSWQTICWANCIAAPFLIVPVALTAPQQTVSATSWLCFAYLGCVSMFLGFVAWYRGLALGGIVRVSQVQLLQVFLTLCWSALLLGEKLSPLMWIAATIVVMMIAIARRAQIRPAGPTQRAKPAAQR